ncbi:MAG: helix-turn-helix domain-containing protein [Oscillospiraceae bacterium]|nr:helix-turn-helix domain-containing protein [Oscillospiraceae bacterium]
MAVLSFGSCNIDAVYEVDHFVRGGETQAVRTFRQFPGGKGLNQSVALARAGVKCFFAGCIGKGDTLLTPVLRQDGVDLRYLRQTDTATGRAIIQLDDAGENAILVYPGANAEVTTDYIDQVLSGFQKGDILLLQNEISNVLYLVERAAELGMKIVLNPSPFSPELLKIDLSKIFCVILNETEAGQWMGSDKPYNFLSYASEKYEDLRVILTLGGKGSIYLHRHKLYRQFAYNVTAVDSTGAGDTFTGYFVAGLCRGESHEVILKNASAAAAMAVSRKGAAVSIPYLADVLEAVDGMAPCTGENAADQRKILKTYIACNLANVDLKDLARVLGYTEGHTSRWIKREFHMTLSEYLQGERCAKAAALLASTSLPVGEIISEVGYQNASFFRSAFARRYGMTPGKYRRSVQGGGGANEE